MKWSVALSAALAIGCSVDIDYKRTTIAFDPVSPPAPRGGAQVIAANGKLILTASHISKDDGVTWAQANPAIMPESAIGKAWSENEVIVNTSQFGWGRWNMETDLVGAIDPPVTVPDMHVTSTGTIIAYPLSSAVIPRQTANGVWSQPTLPMPPTPAGSYPAVYDITSTPNGVFLIADWGVYRSGDDGASWGFVYDPNIVGYLLPLPDGRVGLLNQGRSAIIDILDANGMPTGAINRTIPGSAASPCMGALISYLQYSTDLGQTWQPIMPEIPGVDWTVRNITCGGDYLAVYVSQPNEWLIKMSAFGELTSLYSYTPAAQMFFGEHMVKLDSGTVLSGDLAWRPGESAWSLRILPRFDLYPLADGSLWGHQGREVWRSTDDGVTWTTTTAPADLPVLEAVFAEPNGTMWGAARAMVNMRLWELVRSDDHGVTWQYVWPATEMRDLTPRLVGVARDGTFVGTSEQSGFHVSHDHGETWSSSPFPPGYSFERLTPKHHGVTFDDNDVPNPGQDERDDLTTGVRSFHLWHDYGAGNAFEQVTPVLTTPDMGDQRIDLEPVLPTVVIDAESYVWWYGGTPAGVWRSRRPID